MSCIFEVQGFSHSCEQAQDLNLQYGTPKQTQTVIDATHKETAIDQQQHSCETLICQRH